MQRLQRTSSCEDGPPPRGFAEHATPKKGYAPLFTPAKIALLRPELHDLSCP
ncbi:uncharacterized protein PHACADRAFT_251026 [Phanerochaete carnosa HHB-10118-sp]|uniref:Uncharacterized protein n=1 Tax=Phanerochaete carnosa (strain HHB-10118-sp) TaxID=650164 RepID=K5XB09_PHACS|nr:uncharacterized protein PHACADRAFT_251026 [Phanerochaete carnosa HHB-10118-sp]EKM60127.1 hypothetical protein PHACADRAFT_251026 [Phanerochaete carnosa HHB-10118-sp]